MANTWVQGNQQSFGNSTLTRTLQYTSNITAGDFLWLFVGLLPGSGTAQVGLTVSDNVNGAWTQAGLYSRNTNNGVQCSLWYFVNSAGGSRPIVSVAPAVSAAMGLGINEESVTSPTSVVLDSTTLNNQGATTTTTPTSGTVTVSNAGELVIAGFCETTITLTTMTVGGAFSQRQTQLSAASMAFGTASDENASANEAATWTISNAAKYAAIIASFNTSAAAGGFSKLAGPTAGLAGFGGALAG